MPGGASVLSRFREFSSVASGLPCPIGSPFPRTSSDRRGTRRVPSLFCRRPDEIVARSRSLLLTFYSKGPIFLQIIYRRDSWRRSDKLDARHTGHVGPHIAGPGRTRVAGLLLARVGKQPAPKYYKLSSARRRQLETETKRCGGIALAISRTPEAS